MSTQSAGPGTPEVAWTPDASFIEAANWTAFLRAVGGIDYHRLAARAEAEPEWFWRALIDHLGIRFTRPFDRVLDLDEGSAWPKWGVGGRMNLTATLLERNLELGRGGHPAIRWEGEDGEVREISYDDLARDTLRGTRIHALRSRVAVRKHWLQNAPAEPGGIVIDEGAANALVEKGASLLPGGVITAEGEFRRGDMVEVLLRGEDGSERVARGVSQYSAADIRRIARRHSREIESVLGYSYGGTVIHRDDLMLV